MNGCPETRPASAVEDALLKALTKPSIENVYAQLQLLTSQVQQLREQLTPSPSPIIHGAEAMKEYVKLTCS